MKRLKYILCIAVLIAVSIAVTLFLNIFVADAEKTIQFIEFDSYALKHEDGTLTSMTMDEFYSTDFGEEQLFVFTTEITEENYDDYIQLTPTGMDIRVLIEDTEVYRSQAVLPEAMIDQVTARIPIRGLELPLTVTMEARNLGGVNTIFPPMVFTTSEMTEMMPNLSWGHRSGIPTGAFAMILILLMAFFLYSIVEETPRYSLVPLVIASGIIMVRGICVESGYLFLPDWMSIIFARSELLWLLLAAFLAYFILNRKRVRLFGWCALGSAVVFAGTYLISRIMDGHFAFAVNDLVTGFIEFGEYTRPLLWINYWLQFVCLLVAGITTVQSVSEHMAREQAFALKAELAMENYRVIEEQSKHDALQRHEFKNQISALKMMLEQGKTEAAMQYLMELESRSKTTVIFTGNFAVNAILQSAAARAEELGFQLDAYARIEEQLSIPENDLCSFLFNMLDNAFEAVAQIHDPQKREITIRIKQRGTAVGIYCANSYAVAPEFDHAGNLMSHKAERGHGLGVIQMERIAKKYGTKLDFSYSEELFIAQTVLFLPQKGNREDAPQEIDI